MSQDMISFMAEVPEKVIDVGRQLLPEQFRMVFVPTGANEGEAARIVAQAQYFLGFIAKPQGPTFYEALAGTRLVQLLSAGYDRVDLERLRHRRIPLATNGGANAVAVAEHTIMLILAVLRRLRELDARTRAGHWRPSGPEGEIFELDGKTVGLIGLGMIGRHVAARLRPFEACVRYFDVRRLPPDEEHALGIRYLPLDELLGTADVISLHVPLSATTRTLISRERLGAMKRGAILINTCRGEVVDEQALYEAVRSGHLLGAGLDTFTVEPPDKGNPLFTLANVIVTPHIAGPTWDSWRKRFVNAYANINRVTEGKQPLWVVPELQEVVPWWLVREDQRPCKRRDQSEAKDAEN
jgi:phosphoglycerate dehydrogenase-like enzyme